MIWEYGEEDGCIFVRQVPDHEEMTRAEMWEELQALRAFKLDVGGRLVELERAIKRELTGYDIEHAVGWLLNRYFNPCPNNKRRERDEN